LTHLWRLVDRFCGEFGAQPAELQSGSRHASPCVETALAADLAKRPAARDRESANLNAAA
jgi:hypothetical protein